MQCNLFFFSLSLAFFFFIPLSQEMANEFTSRLMNPVNRLLATRFKTPPSSVSLREKQNTAVKYHGRNYVRENGRETRREHVGLYKFLSNSSRAGFLRRRRLRYAFSPLKVFSARAAISRAATAGCFRARVLSDKPRKELESCGKSSHEFTRHATRREKRRLCRFPPRR